MSYVIMRVEKLKDPGNVAGAAAHIERTRATPNADPAKTASNEWLAGEPGIYQRAKASWEGLDKAPRSNAVHGLEVLLTASPEAFAAGGDRFVAEFKRRSMQWLKKEFESKGAVIVGAQLHLDEATPHVHAIIIPITKDKDGKRGLSARDYVGGRDKLQALQDSVAHGFASMGLERGVRDSKARHQTMKELSAGALALKAELPKATRAPRKEVEIKDGIFASHAEKIVEPSAADAALLDAIKPLKAAAMAGAKSQRGEQQLKKANSKLAADLSDAKRREQESAAQLRQLPLETVAQALGCYKVDRDRWESPAGKLSITGQKFFNHEIEHGGGGSIDLVKHVLDCDYHEALGWLRDTYDPAAAASAAADAARRKALADLKAVPKIAYSEPQHVPERWPRVREYLVKVRGLASDIVDRLKASGWIGADRRGNFWSLKVDQGVPCSTELRGTGASDFKGSAKGSDSDRGVFIVEGGRERLAVCESAIDAISYVQLHPEATAISTAGTGKWRAALPYIEEHAKHFPEVVCASDRGQGGEGMAKRLQLPHEPPPAPQSDWNRYLVEVGVRPDRSIDSMLQKPEKTKEKNHGSELTPGP